MMATEAIPNIEKNASNTPDHDLNTTIETSTQDDFHNPPLTNGTSTDKDEIKQGSEPADTLINSPEASLSGGSDTEASKAETSRGQDEKGHVRSSSIVKKATSFKAVSVNKTFLAAKTTGGASPKLGEKPATTATQSGASTAAAARPRLVAKAGSGLRDSIPRMATMANGGKPGAAPDGNAVWNKNRPVPIPEPKRFTDEELKQRYGIHLASRLQSDDAGKQANWADIDDDEEDWAPETVEWADGTKITLPLADEQPPPAPEPIPVATAKNVDVVKPNPPLPSESASPLLKSGGLSTGRTGLVLKGAAEKPTLVAKPPGPPTPVKSPWATLPPVDKLPPVQIDLAQAQPQQSRFGQRNPHGFDALQPAPAQEIAADDFSRSWRDGNAPVSRELFNSQSGRYEPVNDSRRGGRHEARQPSVLQRPTQQQDGPAEPSPAFQTHRTSINDGGFARRRTSSNVSGGSGNFIRRMSKGHDMPPPTHDMLGMRRGSLAAVSDAPSSPRISLSTQQPNQRSSQSQSWQSRPSPVLSHPSPQTSSVTSFPSGPADNNVQPPDPVQEEDVIEAQKKIMRQTRELAIKRRQEEEAKEEAARKERIRIKLEAMGPPPEKRTKKDMKDDKSVPTQIQTREPSKMAVIENRSDAEAGVNAKSLDMDGKNVARRPRDIKPSNVNTQDHRPNGFHQAISPDAPKQLAQDGPKSQPWQTSSASGPWSSHQNSSRNVWGPPNKDKPLGNGTFNPDLSSGMAEMNQPPHPGPIGPPHRGNHDNQQGRGRPAPIGPPQKQNGATSDDQRAQVMSAWMNLPDKLAREEILLAQQQQAEITKRLELRKAGIAPAEAAQSVVKDTWRKVNLNEDGTRGKTAGVITTVHDDATPTAPPSWKGEEEVATRAAFGQDMSRQHSARSGVQFNDAWKSTSSMGPSPPVRGSRFFPVRDVRLEDPNMVFIERPGSPSPPPPTMLGHPAYDGDVAHPHVLLPRPKPSVKLPPAVQSPIAPPRPVNFAAAVATPVTSQQTYQPRQEYAKVLQSSQDIRRTEATAGQWKDKINNLIGRKSSPPRTLNVDSSSKHALELPTSQMAATVSLPTFSGFKVDESTISKPSSEECFEEQEMGSLPPVKLPHKAPNLAWEPATQPKMFPRKFTVQSTSYDGYPFFPFANNFHSISIMLPGQTVAKSVNYLGNRQRSNPRRASHNHRGSNRPPPSQRGGRGRDTSGSFPPPSTDNASVSSSPVSGRGRARGYGNHWNRHTSTPIHT